MDKKTIAAFALSFLVLLLWSWLFAPRPEQKSSPPVRQEEAEKKAAPEPERAPATPQPAGPLPAAQASEGREKEILVETPLYKAVFSNAGPALKSFRLKKYHLTADDQSPLVELAHGKTDLLTVTVDPFQKQGEAPILFNASETALVLDSGSSPKALIFTATTAEGLSLRQSFLIDPNRYPIELDVTSINQTGRTVEGTVHARIANLPPKEKTSYYAFIGLSVLLDGKLKELEADDFEKEEIAFSGNVQWASYQEDYFMAAVIPEKSQEARFVGRMLPSGILEGIWSRSAGAVKPGEQLSTRFTLFLGPRDLSVLKEIGNHLDQAINFGWFDIIAKPLLYALRFFNGYVHNYGIAIIILTVLIKIIFWPLTHKSYKSMKEMQKLQPLMAKIREKYKGNREQMNKELMGLYRTYKVNPMGGCLPMLIQIPVFFALFRILGNSIELRHAPFFLWINDLSAPDRLFRFSFEVPFMSPPYGIPVLTLLMGASMFIQQKMTPTPGDPTQAKIMLLLPIIFTVMFINFPSGLVLYWLVNNILSIGQQYRIIKRPA
jgi:YidC/Oxa1 family membrane protein insertase